MKIPLDLLRILLLCGALLNSAKGDVTCNNPDTLNSTGMSVPDCNCRFHSVDHAVKHFISPILNTLTTKTFFRYFKVDLESPCPYWPTVGQCMMEGCSVCTCDEDEIPKPWLEYESKKAQRNEYGWVASSSSPYGFESQSLDDSLGKISIAEGETPNMQLDEMYNDSQARNRDVMVMETGTARGIQSDPEEDTDDSDDWTILDGSGRKSSLPDTKNLPTFAASYGYNALFDPVETAEEVVKDASYVNLLENPERFTGYSGPSAQRVWQAIQQENCFGEQNDVCLEKRVFYRLMSGMQSSISTHIARNYLHPDGQWGTNHALYWRAVGNYPDRLNNMYFSFLFLLRAVVRAQETLRTYEYNTGHAEDDQIVKELLNKLLESSGPVRDPAQASAQYSTKAEQAAHSPENSLKELLRSSGDAFDADAMAAVEECRYGFNESELFQVSEAQRGPQYWNTLEDKQELRDEFMIKFRNISRIMDCVTCEKCRVWGKLQILGFGTAIKILLHPVDKIVSPTTTTVSTKNGANGVPAGATASPGEATTVGAAAPATCDVLATKQRSRLTLSRQEIIALLNTLNQFSNSLIFAAEAAELAGRGDIAEQPVQFASVLGTNDAGSIPAQDGLLYLAAVLNAPWMQWVMKLCPSLASGVAIVWMMKRKVQREKEAKQARQARRAAAN